MSNDNNGSYSPPRKRPPWGWLCVGIVLGASLLAIASSSGIIEKLFGPSLPPFAEIRSRFEGRLKAQRDDWYEFDWHDQGPKHVSVQVASPITFRRGSHEVQIPHYFVVYCHDAREVIYINSVYVSGVRGGYWESHEAPFAKFSWSLQEEGLDSEVGNPELCALSRERATELAAALRYALGWEQ